MVIIIFAIIFPQIIIIYNETRQRKLLKTEVQQLREKIEEISQK